MSDFLKHFYFFSKLATNFVLLGIIIFLGYISDLVGVQNATLLSSLILIICIVTFLILRKRIFTISNSADEIVGGIREKSIVS